MVENLTEVRILNIITGGGRCLCEWENDSGSYPVSRRGYRSSVYNEASLTNCRQQCCNFLGCEAPIWATYTFNGEKYSCSSVQASSPTGYNAAYYSRSNSDGCILS